MQIWQFDRIKNLIFEYFERKHQRELDYEPMRLVEVLKKEKVKK